MAADREAWHAKRLATLSADDGWLTLVGLDFLENGSYTLGALPDCALRYQGSGAPLAGRFEVMGDSVSYRAADGVAATLDRAACTECAMVADDAGTPTVLRVGTLAITLVRRNGELALRVKDSASPVRTGFAGIGIYPFDDGSVVEATVEPAATGETVAITNVMGFVEEQPVAATLRFTLAGASRSLVATAGASGRYFVVFGDQTNGTETYGGGRFLDIPSAVDGRTVIDFNRATNPPCSFTAFATCPTPPEANRLPLPIRAGERMPSGH
ncbi:MAG: DUF1684 domain-containing protein [Planctomycetota bacterium]